MDAGLFLKIDGADIEIFNEDIVTDSGLETAVLISIFSDRRVTDEELPDFENSKRGWWADTISEIDQDFIGSKVWLYERSKVTTIAALNIQQAINESLLWLIEDGAASAVNTVYSIVSAERIDFAVDITKNSGENQRFDLIWEGQRLRRG